MFIKVFEGNTPLEVETKVNNYLKTDIMNEFDLHSLTQSESMAVVNSKLERKITITCIFIERLYQDEDDF